MKSYLPLDEKRFSLKWLLAVGGVFLLVTFVGLESKHGLQLKGYLKDEVFVTYMDEKDIVFQEMEEVYDENAELMNVVTESVGVHHTYDEETDELVPVLDITPQYTKAQVDVKVNQLSGLMQSKLSATQKTELSKDVTAAKSKTGSLSADGINAVGGALTEVYSNFGPLTNPSSPVDAIGAGLNIIAAIAPLAGPVGGIIGAFAGILSFGLSLFGGGGGGGNGMQAVVDAVDAIVAQYFEQHRDIMVRGNIDGMNRALIEIAGELSTSDMSSTSENCRDWANSYVVDEMGVSLGIFYNAIESQFASNPDLSVNYLYYYCYMSTVRLFQIEQIHLLSLAHNEKELATRLEGRIKAIKDQDYRNLRFDTTKNDVYTKTMDRIYWKGVESDVFKVIDRYRQICGLQSISTYYSAPSVIGVNYRGIFANGEFYIRENNAWVKKSGGLTNVAIGDDGFIWGVNRVYQIYQYQFKSNTWINVPGGLKQIDIGKHNLVWGVNVNDYIYRWTGSTWQNIGGRLKQVSVGSDGTVWGVNKDDYIYRWTGSTWQGISGRLKQISVGSANQIWGVNSANSIYRWTGSTWQQISGGLSWVCVSKTGTNIWGVNRNYEIYRRTGNTWTRVSGGLVQVDCR